MKFFLKFVIVIISFHCQAQKNNIHPSRVYCDTNYSVLDIMQNDDGSYLTVGSKIDNGVLDGLIMKLDINYNIIWKKNYGGSLNDRFDFIKKINNNRYLVAGSATSIDGDLAAYSWPFTTASNIWLMIIDSNGNFIHGNTYGYGSSTTLSGIQLRSDGNIFLSGTTVADGGDFSNNPGNFLVNQTFVALTDTLLTKKWLRYIAGLSSDDNTCGPNCLDKNENLIIPIISNSFSGDYAGLGSIGGTTDAFLFTIDTNQNIIYRNHYYGSQSELINEVSCDSNNNRILVANTNSLDGDFFTNEVKWKSGTYPSYASILKTDSTGIILWKHAFGSFDTTMNETRNVEPKELIIIGNKIWVASKIQGRDSIGEGFGWTTQLGSADIWITQFDLMGNLENKIRLGGLRFDVPHCMIEKNDKNKILICLTSFGDPLYSNFECYLENNAESKVFELEQWPVGIKNINKPLNLDWTITPNPNNGNFEVKFDKEFNGFFKILNREGKNVFQKKLTGSFKYEMKINRLVSGVYYFEISTADGRQVKQVILNN